MSTYSAELPGELFRIYSRLVAEVPRKAPKGYVWIRRTSSLVHSDEVRTFAPPGQMGDRIKPMDTFPPNSDDRGPIFWEAYTLDSIGSAQVIWQRASHTSINRATGSRTEDGRYLVWVDDQWTDKQDQLGDGCHFLRMLYMVEAEVIQHRR